MDCPFDKTHKPELAMSSEEMSDFYRKLGASWIGIRDKVGVEQALETSVTATFSQREISCLIKCLTGVLYECDGDPLELELRVGKLEDVKYIAKQLEQMENSN